MEQAKVEVLMWPVKALLSHPDNPRTVRTASDKFQNLLASVQANGVIEPLMVRLDPGGTPSWRQILSGHRRFAAAQLAGVKLVPVIDKGDLPDSLAFDIVALGNEHEDLTPLEEGRRIATWLDKYGQDISAVASKVGKPAHWVIQHAQIARGLSAEWQKAATELAMLDRWTAGHWAVIARLPAALQASELAKFRNNAYCSYDRWTVKELESRIKLEVLYLAKAPFEIATCDSCIDRTDRQPLLWGETVEQAAGDKARCLNKKCWEKKAAAYAKRELKAVANEKGVPAAVPLSLLERPRSWPESGRYDDRIRELKKQYGPKLLTADKVEVVPEGTKGAVAAIAVAGVRGKGAMGVRWVKVREEKPAGSGHKPSAADIKRQKEKERWDAVSAVAVERMGKLPTPSPAAVLWVLCWIDWSLCWNAPQGLAKKFAKDNVDASEFAALVADLFWQAMLMEFYPAHDIEETLRAVCPVLGIDVQKIYDEVVAAEKPSPEAVNKVSEVNGVQKSSKAKKRASGAARRKKSKKAKSKSKESDPIDGEEDGACE